MYVCMYVCMTVCMTVCIVDILSACNTDTCGPGGDWYIRKSGTSMSCPHVTGVLAQLLQKSGNTASQATLAQALICTATRERLGLDALDTVSRNLLLHVPVLTNGVAMDSGIIDHGCNAALTQCSSLACSGRGVCLPTRPSSTVKPLHSLFYDGLTLLPPVSDGTSTSCHCDVGYFGSHCEFAAAALLSLDPGSGMYEVTCPMDNMSVLLLELVDTEGRCMWVYECGCMHECAAAGTSGHGG